MSWIDQGRQQHGWFGHGTGSASPASSRELRERAFAIVQLARDHLAQGDSASFPHEKTTEILRTLAAIMAPSSDLSPSQFRQRFFRNGFDPVDAWQLQSLMRDVVNADHHAKLEEAGQALAKTIDSYGAKEWSSLLGRTVANIAPVQRTDPRAKAGLLQEAQLRLPAPLMLPLPFVAVPGSRENEEDFVKPTIRVGRAVGELLGTILHAKPPREGDGYEGGADKPPVGSRPIDETPWSGNHEEIKSDIGAERHDDTRISPGGDVWSQHPDGSWTNYGRVSDWTASGRPAGQRGKDRR